MARTYHVKKAQQRYETKPVLNEDGSQKVTPKMRNGVQMKTKSGRLVFVNITERDLTRPKPMPKCSGCGNEILVDDPYKYTEAYNRTIIRCKDCPAPQQWEYSNSLSARLAQIDHEQGDLSKCETLEDLESARDEYAQAIREIAEEKEEAAQNIEDGFQHETYQSTEIREQAEQLNSWADDIEAVDFGDEPEPEEEDCPECGGTGHVEDEDSEEHECTNCDSTGQVQLEEPSEDQMAEWLDTARDALQNVFGECPV